MDSAATRGSARSDGALRFDPQLFEAVRIGPVDARFSDFERAILLATEELIVHHRVGAASWEALATKWSEQQLLDFLFTVGSYVMVAGVMRKRGAEMGE